MADDAAAASSSVDIGAVQSFWATVDQRFSDTDTLLKNFKRNELDATIAAASTGKYAEYWTVEKLADLNNAVDANQSCHPDLKALFAANATKSVRLKANRIGGLVFQYVAKLMESGLPSFSAPAPAPAPAAAAAGGGITQGGEGYGRLQRYVFAPHLPPDCQLRVRSGPSTDAEPLGYVTQHDEIYADRRQGDWIAVRLADLSQEAWMLVCTSEQQLLVPTSEPAPVPAPVSHPPPASYPAQPAGPAPSLSAAPSAAAAPAPFFPQQPVPVAAAAQGFGNPMQGVGYMGGNTGPVFSAAVPPLGVNPLSMSQTLNPDSFRPSSAAPINRMMPDTVPYAAYQALEQRVSILEHVIQQMRSVLRSL